MARASTGFHVRLRPEAIPVLQAVYGPGLDAAHSWRVETVDGGYYDRDGLHLVREEDGLRLLAWRSQVSPMPRCEYCGREGHTKSRATAKTCPVVAEGVVELRKLQSARMKARKRDAAGRLVAP